MSHRLYSRLVTFLGVGSTDKVYRHPIFPLSYPPCCSLTLRPPTPPTPLHTRTRETMKQAQAQRPQVLLLLLLSQHCRRLPQALDGSKGEGPR